MPNESLVSDRTYLLGTRIDVWKRSTPEPIVRVHLSDSVEHTVLTAVSEPFGRARVNVTMGQEAYLGQHLHCRDPQALKHWCLRVIEMIDQHFPDEGQ